MFLAPRWAFSAQAIDATGDPRLAPGVHVRALLSDTLGLPAAPLVVYRVPGNIYKQRSDVRWVDSHGSVLSYPFKVTPDNPVTGWLPAGSTCCYFEMLGQADSIILRPPFPLPVGLVDPAINQAVPHPASLASLEAQQGTGNTPKPQVGSVIQPMQITQPVGTLQPVAPGAPSGAGKIPVLDPVTNRVTNPILNPVLNPIGPVGPVIPLPVPPTVFSRLAAFQLDAVVSTARGLAVVSTRTGQPYQVAASHIEQVVVHGSGTVTGANWMDASMLGLRAQFWRQWTIPVHTGPRYVSTATAGAEAQARVQAGAPLRHALYQEPTAASVAAASPAGAPEELARVTGLVNNLGPWMQRLVSDMSADPWALTQPFTVTSNGNPGTAKMPLLGMALQATMDPGLARWAGLCDLDTPATAPAGTVMFYLISGVWHLDPAHPLPKQLLATLPAGSIFDPATIPINKRLPLQGVDANLPAGQYVELWAVAAAITGAPGNPPLPPAMAPGVGPWMPSPPAAPLRQVPVDLSGLVPGAALAFARQDGTGIVPLNPVSSTTGKPLPLVLSPTKASTVSGVSQVTDRKAPPRVLTYRASQSDWFGRFSPWAFANAPDQPRTAPHKPTPEIFYTPPVPVGSGPLAGTLLLRVPVPPDSALPPGCGPLTGLVVNATADGLSWTVNANYPAGGGLPNVVLQPPPPGAQQPIPPMLSITIPGPGLAVAGSTTVHLVAEWQTATATSLPSDPVERFIGDPRPAPPPTIPSALRYTSKPDAAGLARFEIDLPVVAGVKYRVFYADENQLLKGLQKLAVSTDTTLPPGLPGLAAGALAGMGNLATLDATGRAAFFMAHAGLYTYDMFQSLSVSAIDGGTFAHSLSGSLKTLSFYRVITWNASNVGSDFLSSPLVPVAIPNDLPPARPSISAAPVKSGGAIAGVAVQVTVPRSGVDPVFYRIRRSFAGPTPDPRLMLIVYEGALTPGGGGPTGPLQTGPNGTTFVHTDTQNLRPWRHYAWAVEVRGGAPVGSPPGTTIHGDYGPPSKPASAMIVPPDPPAPVLTLTGSRDGAGHAVLRWTVSGDPLGLMSTDLGPYKFELFRTPAGTRPAIVALPPTLQPGADGSFQFTDTGTPPGAVGYRVVVVDPLGRASVPGPTLTV